MRKRERESNKCCREGVARARYIMACFVSQSVAKGSQRVYSILQQGQDMRSVSIICGKEGLYTINDNVAEIYCQR